MCDIVVPYGSANPCRRFGRPSGTGAVSRLPSQGSVRGADSTLGYFRFVPPGRLRQSRHIGFADRGCFGRPSGAGAVSGSGPQGSVRDADSTLGYSRIVPPGRALSEAGAKCFLTEPSIIGNSQHAPAGQFLPEGGFENSPGWSAAEPWASDQAMIRAPRRAARNKHPNTWSNQ